MNYCDSAADEVKNLLFADGQYVCHRAVFRGIKQSVEARDGNRCCFRSNLLGERQDACLEELLAGEPVPNENIFITASRDEDLWFGRRDNHVTDKLLVPKTKVFNDVCLGDVA